MKHSHFSFGEMTSDSSNGKTSIGKVSGLLIIVIGLICFFYTLYYYSTSIYIIQILAACTTLVFFGSGLILGKILVPTKIEDTSKVCEKENNSENN